MKEFKTGQKLASGNVQTPVGRVSFAHVFRAQAMEGNEPKYSLTLLFDENADLSLLKELCHAACVAKWGADYKTKIPALRSPFRDQGEKPFDGYVPGRKFINVSTKDKPGLVDAKGLRIDDESLFYSGCYAWCSVRAYAYDQKGNKGVALGLANIQKIRDGEPLNGRAKAESEFKAVDVPAEGTAAGAASVFD